LTQTGVSGTISRMAQLKADAKDTAQSAAATEAASAKTKARSPSYPSVTAVAALALASKIYAAEKRFAVLPATVTKHGGYEGTKSGPAARLLSALKKYQVFQEKTGDTLLHMAEPIRRHVMAPADTALRDKILADMAGRYDEIVQALAKYPDGLPGDEALKSYLVLERKFTDSGATEFIEILREYPNIESAGIASQDDGMSNGTQTNPPAGSSFRSPSSPPPTLPKPPGEFVLRWNVSSDRVVEFRASGDLTPDDWELVADYVGVAKKAAARRAKQDGETKD
jgi:hypothetical protein